MKPASDLHELIISLSPNEKGYFKKYCQRSGATSRKYLRLFDAIASQKEYDEKKLKKKLADPVLERNLSSEKNYLFHLILEALISGNTMQDPAYESGLLLAKARWLAAHSFYENAGRFARKAAQFAEENELFTMYLDALDVEWLLWQYLPEQERRSPDTIVEERKEAMRQLAAADELRILDVKLIRLFQETGIGRDAEHIGKFREIYEASLEAAEKFKPLPVRASACLHNIALFYGNVSGEAENSRHHLNEVLRLLESKELIKRERLSFYISTLNNLILLLVYMGAYDEAKEKIGMLETIKGETQSQRNTIFITRYNTFFELYTHTREWNAAFALSQELKNEFPKFQDKVDNRYTGHIRFAAFRSCFYTGHYREALHWINQLVQKSKGEPFKTELLMIARICELAIHETMGNYDLLENLLNSAQRYLEKNNRLYHFEKITLDFFAALLRNPGNTAPFTDYGKRLSEIEKDLMETRVFSYFDFRAWVKARLAGKTVSEIELG